MQATCSCLLSFLLLICIVYSSKISPRVVSLLTLKQETRNAGSEEQVHLWVYFSDKDLQVPYEVVLGQLHPNALQRRSKVMNSNSNSNNGFVDLHDYPVNGHYITQVEACGVVVRRTSKWLNAISCSVSPSNLMHVIQRVSDLAFVSSIDVMASYIRKSNSISQVNGRSERQEAFEGLDYGHSFDQLQMINVPNAHARGYNGTGVTILILDSGFDKTHPAISPLRIIAEYDFIENDNQTQSFPPDDQNYHGTATLSCVGGWAPGDTIGAAFGASFILAKTEVIQSETRTEEDNFIAAVEWGESLGADLVTASLGYTMWYKYYDIDGTVSPVTIACDKASKRGLSVVISAGNEGIHGIATPADGFEVIAVGAAESNGAVSTFSSLGPASDGRIKPDVAARGTNVWIANTRDVPAAKDKTNWYTQGSGTSYSCPLVAGVVAMIIQIHPEWTPRMIREALQMTASQASSPGVSLGWGIVDAVSAVHHTSKNGSCETNGCSQRGCCIGGECQCNYEFFGPFCNFNKLSCTSTCSERTNGIGECLRSPVGKSYRCVLPGSINTDSFTTPQCDSCPLGSCNVSTPAPTEPPTSADPTAPPLVALTITSSSSTSSSTSHVSAATLNGRSSLVEVVLLSYLFNQQKQN